MGVAGRDVNFVTTLTALSSVDHTTIVPLYADPTTHRLLTDSAAGNSIAIGAAVTSGTAGSVLFVGAGAVLAQNNTNFFWDDTNTQLQIGPSAGFDGNSQIQVSVSSNVNNYAGIYVQNKNGGDTASTDIILGADNDGVALTGHYIDVGIEGSGNSGGTLFTMLTPDDGYTVVSGGNLVLATDGSVAGKVIKFFTGGTLVANESARLSSSGLSVGLAGTTLGKVLFQGSTSGTTTVQPAVAASGTLTLPAATDTLVGKATTDTLTNKTFDTAGTGNVFKINGTTISANTGTGSNVLATSPTLVTPVLGVATATSINKVAITAPATSATLTIADGKTLTANSTLTLAGTDSKTLTISNSLALAGTDSTTMTFPSTSASIARTDAAQTFTGTQTFSQTNLTANAITASGNAATVPITSGRNIVTNNSAATLTITMTTTSAVNMQTCIVQILDASAAAQTVTWVNTENSAVSAPTTSNGSTTLPLTAGFIYNSATSKWRCVASA